MIELNVAILCPACQRSITIDLMACDNGTQILCDNCKTIINLQFKDAIPRQVIESFNERITDSFKKAGFKVNVN